MSLEQAKVPFWVDMNAARIWLSLADDAARVQQMAARWATDLPGARAAAGGHAVRLPRVGMHLARRLWATLEPLHDVIYFAAPEAAVDPGSTRQ